MSDVLLKIIIKLKIIDEKLKIKNIYFLLLIKLIIIIEWLDRKWIGRPKVEVCCDERPLHSVCRKIMSGGVGVRGDDKMTRDIPRPRDCKVQI